MGWEMKPSAPATLTLVLSVVFAALSLLLMFVGRIKFSGNIAFSAWLLLFLGNMMDGI